MSFYLTQSLHRAVRSTPHRLATVCDGRRQTYAELAERVARLGGLLQTFGVLRGDRVGWLALNSDRVLELILGSFWTGAVACPLNSRWSSREIIDAIRDCQIKIMVVGHEFRPLLDEIRASCPDVHNWLVLGDAPAPPGVLGYEDNVREAPACKDQLSRGDDPALILYTGGTTGKPKGVVVTHNGLASAALSMHAMVGAPGQSFLTVAPLFHMGGLQVVFYHFLGGGTFVICSAFHPQEALALMQQEAVTDVMLVPTMLDALLGEVERAGKGLPALGRVFYGAAPASVTLLDLAQRLLPDADFVEGFGMSETAMTCILTPADHRAGKAKRAGIIGRPCPHVELRIVGPDGQDLAAGAIGEITVRGPSVTPGYWNNPQETAIAIRDGWIHTGDAGYFDDEGYIYLADRIKDMIISGGENVYSTEVENVVATHRAVAQCAVIGLADDYWGEIVHAVVVLRPGATLTIEALREHCRQFLAGYKCPRSLQILASLPITSAGKVAKNELRKISLPAQGTNARS